MSNQVEKYRKQAKRVKKTLQKHSIEAPLNVCQDVVAHVHGAHSFDDLVGRKEEDGSHSIWLVSYSNESGLTSMQFQKKEQAIDYLFNYVEMHWNQAIEDAAGFGDDSVPEDVPQDKETAIRLYFQHKWGEDYKIEAIAIGPQTSGAKKLLELADEMLKAIAQDIYVDTGMFDDAIEEERFDSMVEHMQSVVMSGAHELRRLAGQEKLGYQPDQSGPPCFLCQKPIAAHNNEICDECIEKRTCPVCSERKEPDEVVCRECRPCAGEVAVMDTAPDNPIIIAEVPEKQPLAEFNVFQVIDTYGDGHFVMRDGHDLNIVMDNMEIGVYGKTISELWPRD